MNQAHFAGKNSFSRPTRTPFGECLSEAVTGQAVPASGAESSPDRFSRCPALWSRSSLRSRAGIEVSCTWPSLTRLSSAPHITARPFGLGSRFDVVPTGSADRSLDILAPAVDTHPRERRGFYHTNSGRSSARDRDGAEGGDANAAPVPKDHQARPEGIAKHD